MGSRRKNGNKEVKNKVKMGVGGGERSMKGREGKEGGNEEGKGGEKISGGIVPQIFSFVEVLLNQ